MNVRYKNEMLDSDLGIMWTVNEWSVDQLIKS